MSRVVLSGYYGFHNLGDDAVLAATVTALRRRRPGLEITVLTRDPQGTARAFGVEGISRTHPGALLRALRRCDLFLSGGGSLFQDATSWRSPWYYLGALGLARRLARRTCVYAQGIGPLRGPAARAVARRLLNAVDIITVRDPESLAALAALGVSRRAVLAGDPALLLLPERSPRVLAERSRWGPGLHVGLALRPWGDDAWRDAVSDAARSAVARHGVRWICLAMQRPADADFAERVAARIGEGAHVVREPFRAGEMLALIGGLRLVVGMRLHALIFAAIQGVPVLALAYDPKVAAFARELREPVLPVAGLAAAPVGAAIDAAVVELGERRARVLAAAALLRARAQLAPDLAAALLP